MADPTQRSGAWEGFETASICSQGRVVRHVAAIWSDRIRRNKTDVLAMHCVIYHLHP